MFSRISFGGRSQPDTWRLVLDFSQDDVSPATPIKCALRPAGLEMPLAECCDAPGSLTTNSAALLQGGEGRCRGGRRQAAGRGSGVDLG